MNENTGFYTDAHRKATNKYRQSRAQITMTISKEQKEQIQQAATKEGKSVTQFIIDKVLNN